ncbi:hypothetical protein GGF46_002397 [Coemansia sp. RSA 552]|nr:hypothetical protein GGF46_002397 [Coemansia sp. RSA 552]
MLRAAAATCRTLRGIRKCRHYTTVTSSGQPDAKPKAPKMKHKVLQPLSPAIQNLALEMEGDFLNTSVPDVVGEIDAHRFTTGDLLAELPSHYSQGLGSETAVVDSAADLAAMSAGKTVRVMQKIREQRASRIKAAFTNEQLKKYLGEKGLPITGAKAKLVDRIIDSAWGITASAIQARCSEGKSAVVEESFSLTLDDDVLAQVEESGEDQLHALAAQFGTTATLDRANKVLRVQGTAHNMRAALAMLRDKLSADTIVSIDLAKYGTPRPLSDSYIGQATNFVDIQYGDSGSVKYSDGVHYAQGATRTDSLDIQLALVRALVEPENSSVFVAVPREAAGSCLSTVVPAVDFISEPRTFVPRSAFFTLMDLKTASPASVLEHHELYRRGSEQRFVRREDGSLAHELHAWMTDGCNVPDAQKPNSLALSLGKVMFDLDRSHEPLFDRFHRPQALLDSLSTRAPLFGFSRQVSPIRWLRSQDEQDTATRQLVMTFRSLPPEDGQGPAGSKAQYMLPQYGSDRLVVRIDMDAGKIMFGNAQIERMEGMRSASVAVFQSEYDFRLELCRRQAVETTEELVNALRDVSHRLGISGSREKRAAPRRHETLQTPLGRYGLVGIELDGVTRRRLAGGHLAQVHQAWNIIDNLRFSSVEITPAQPIHTLLQDRDEDGSEWQRLILYMLGAAARK